MIEYIITPILGGVIGLGTNYLALRMLFHPLKPVYLGGKQLPLTPGLIPKEQDRIASALGKSIADNLLDETTLEQALTSELAHEKIKEVAREIIFKYYQNEKTFSQLFDELQLSESVDKFIDKLDSQMCSRINNYLETANLGEQLFSVAAEKITAKLNPMILMVANPVIASAHDEVVKFINKTVQERSGEIIHNFITSQYADAKETTPVELLEKMQIGVNVEKICDMIIEGYDKIVHSHSKQIISAIDIQGICTEKIKSFDPAQLEQIILEIADKEMNALVAIGGVLGLIIGIINSVIMYLF